MKKLKSILDYYFNIICLGLIIFLLSGIIVLIYRSYNSKNDNIKVQVDEKQVSINEENNNDEILETIKVDIKGAIKKPGVYEISKNSNVLDLINMAGGLTKNASTANINLSRVLENQMVIKIFSKSELKKNNVDDTKISECVCSKVEINNCTDTNSAIIKTEGENINLENNSENNIDTTTTKNNEKELISINTATKSELMNINNIGEAKANAIIEYRNINGNYKNIEEIKNVSGIGDSLFEKIKSFITI